MATHRAGWLPGRPSAGRVGSEHMFVPARAVTHARARRRSRPDPVRDGRDRWRGGQASRPRRRRRDPDPGQRGHRGPAAGAGGGDRPVAGGVRAGRGRGGAGVQPAQRPDRNGHRPGGGGGHRVRRAAWPSGRAAYPERGEGGGDRQRTSRHRRRAGTGHLSPVAGRDAPPAGRGPDGTQARRATVISHLAGTVCAISPEGAVIEVGGVGLLVQCTPGTLATLRAGEQARVATSLVVREDALTLFGFTTDDERDVFVLLQTASGVGPRLALAMLAVFTPDALRRAVATEDVAALTRVPGIGRKGAQRIVLELAGRLGSPGDVPISAPAAAGQAGTRAAPWREQVRAGLVSLGWQAREADQAIAAVEPELTAGAPGQAAGGQAVDVAVALRAALRVLGRA